MAASSSHSAIDALNGLWRMNGTLRVVDAPTIAAVERFVVA